MSMLIHIDDHALNVEPGITILQAARQNEIDIPTLCDFPGLPSHGSCRMCIVEIQGRANTPTSCTTPVEDGMVIYTHSNKVQTLRTELLQMLLAEHPSGCLFCPEKDRCDECMITLRKASVTTGCGSCPKDNQCELQSLAEKYGIEKPEYPIHYRMIPVEKRDPFFDRDDNLCILCGRCIRVCEDLHFASTLAYTKRGTHTLVDTAFHLTHLETSCTFCGACVEVCPTGALAEKTRKWDGAPERETASTCPLCSIGCQIKVLSKKERVMGTLPNRAAGTNVLCVKGRFGITELVNHPTRLKQPQKRAEQTWLGVGWDEAIQSAAEKLSACPPERFEMHISADCTTEDLYVAKRFAHEVMGTSEIYSSGLAGSGQAIDILFGLLKDSQPLESVNDASVFVCLGLEDRYAQSVVEVYLHKAKNRGAKIVTIASRGSSLSLYADEWLRVEPGEEVRLMIKLVEQTGTDPREPRESVSSALGRAAALLQQSSAPVILLGPALLSHPENKDALRLVAEMAQNLRARLIVLPDQANLGAALRLGLGRGGPHHGMRDPQVLYLIGEAVPDEGVGEPFILYQNLYPPAAGHGVDLLLPTTAFTEEHGTYIDYAGRVQETHPAVQPPGGALPSWMILSRIARQMGAVGFDYTCIEDIQAEIPGFAQSWQPLPENGETKVGEDVLDCPSEQIGAHRYMGFPLTQWVGGLRTLYSEETNGRAHEPNS